MRSVVELGTVPGGVMAAAKLVRAITMIDEEYMMIMMLKLIYKQLGL
jgi:hypothetical protein